MSETGLIWHSMGFVRTCEQEYMSCTKTDSILFSFYSELLEDLERSPHAAAIAECFVERVSTWL